MSAAFFRSLFEELPRPKPLPMFPHPNCHPYAVRCIRGPPMAVVPVASGPLSTYWARDEVPIPGQPDGPPEWWPYSPQESDSPACPMPPPCTSPPPCPSPPQQEPDLVLLKPKKTYLGRKRTLVVRKSPPLQGLTTAPLPARRKKNEKRCGR